MQKPSRPVPHMSRKHVSQGLASSVVITAPVTDCSLELKLEVGGKLEQGRV